MAPHPAANLGDSSSEHLDAERAVMRRDALGWSGTASGSAFRQQEMEVEMNRFHAALRVARHELRDERRAAAWHQDVPSVGVGSIYKVNEGGEEIADELREEDALLRDSLVLLEVERTILDERLHAEHALSKVLEERRRLARLIAGDSTSQEVTSLGRAFRRVVSALDVQTAESNFPDTRSSPPSAR